MLIMSYCDGYLFFFLFLDSWIIIWTLSEHRGIKPDHHTMATFYFYSIQYIWHEDSKGRKTFQTEKRKVSESTYWHTQPQGYQPKATVNISNVKRLLPKQPHLTHRIVFCSCPQLFTLIFTLTVDGVRMLRKDSFLFIYFFKGLKNTSYSSTF